MLHPLATLLSPAYALSFGVALATSAAILLMGSRDVGRRLCGLGLTIGALAGWLWSGDPQGVFGAFVAGIGLVIGAAIDAARSPRWLRWVVIVAFSVACVWVTLGQPTNLPSARALRIDLGTGAVLLCGAWLVLLLRLEMHRDGERGLEGAVALGVIAFGIGAVATVVDVANIAGTAFGTAAACLGFAVLAWPMKLPLSMSVTLGGGGLVLSLAQRLGAAWPTAIAPLLILLFCLFTGATARRMPWTNALRPLWSLVLSSVPAIAATLTAIALKAH